MRRRKPQITQITPIYLIFLAKGVDSLHHELVSDFLRNLCNLRFLLSFFRCGGVGFPENG
jgi:hypothetical protein